MIRNTAATFAIMLWASGAWGQGYTPPAGTIVSLPVSASNGGTGVSAPTANTIPSANGSGAFNFITQVTGDCLIGQASGPALFQGCGGNVPTNLTLTVPNTGTVLAFPAVSSLTFTLPGASATLAGLGLTQTFTGANTFQNSTVFSGNMLISVTHIAGSSAITIPSTNFCTSPSIHSNTFTITALLTVGSACTGISTSVLTFPAATTGGTWVCHATDATNDALYSLSAYGTSTTSVTVNNYSRTTGVAIAFGAGDVLQISCWGA